eukprot:TRINITY_DN24041_c0_g1_i1.p1 TRINITY_DN24041_c0_g1~~TRINITY_DN24041_c0_g1_i1.p1  ORF type:complete len:525 (+),score=50.49 TRINITY_DN24041_c0_g1_i1:58-1632(+)
MTMLPEKTVRQPSRSDEATVIGAPVNDESSATKTCKGTDSGECTGTHTKTDTGDWRGVSLLSLAWACTFATLTAAIACIALAGKAFCPSPALTTLPLACAIFSVGFANVAIPFELQYFARSGCYLIGTFVGFLGCLAAAVACWISSFALICCGGACIGFGVAHGQTYRFAAVLLAPSHVPRAIGRVLAGGVLGAILGPGVLARLRPIFLDAEFAGVFLGAACMFIISTLLLRFVHFPPQPVNTASTKDVDVYLAVRPLRKVYAQPSCLAATVVVVIVYTTMTMVMAPTPIVMQAAHGHSFDEASLVMMVHMALMFAPSAGTGALVSRVGVEPVVVVGAFFLGLCSVVLLLGSSLAHFFLGLAFLGIGFNGVFVAGTAGLVRSCRPGEGPRVQAINDMCVFLCSGIGALVSFPIVNSLGWAGLNIFAIVLSIIIVIVALASAFSDKAISGKQQPPAAEPARVTAHPVAAMEPVEVLPLQADELQTVPAIPLACSGNSGCAKETSGEASANAAQNATDVGGHLVSL